MIVGKHYCQVYWWLRTGIFHIYIAKNSHDSSRPVPSETVICRSHLNIQDIIMPSLILLLSLQTWWKNCIVSTPDDRNYWRLVSLGSAWLRFVTANVVEVEHGNFLIKLLIITDFLDYTFCEFVPFFVSLCLIVSFYCLAWTSLAPLLFFVCLWRRLSCVCVFWLVWYGISPWLIM